MYCIGVSKQGGFGAEESTRTLPLIKNAKLTSTNNKSSKSKAIIKRQSSKSDPMDSSVVWTRAYPMHSIQGLQIQSQSTNTMKESHGLETQNMFIFEN